KRNERKQEANAEGDQEDCPERVVDCQHLFAPFAPNRATTPTLVIRERVGTRYSRRPTAHAITARFRRQLDLTPRPPSLRGKGVPSSESLSVPNVGEVRICGPRMSKAPPSLRGKGA